MNEEIWQDVDRIVVQSYQCDKFMIEMKKLIPYIVFTPEEHLLNSLTLPLEKLIYNFVFFTLNKSKAYELFGVRGWQRIETFIKGIHGMHDTPAIELLPLIVTCRTLNVDAYGLVQLVEAIY